MNRCPEKDEVYNFDCIISIDIIKVETISTVRGATRIWNMTIQFWIAEYVYRRFPIKKLRYISKNIIMIFMNYNFFFFIEER